MSSLQVVVLRGGPSAEREVSLRSGASVARALRALGHRVIEQDADGVRLSLPAGTDAVFLALHGTYGEDGSVQEHLEALGVPYTGSGVEGSRVAFDKVRTKERCVGAGIPTPRFVVVEGAGGGWPAGWHPPVVLKPARQGSSVGLGFVDQADQWGPMLERALAHDTRVLVEERVRGREVTVGILDGAPLPLVEVRPKAGVYDYGNKYTPGATEYECPAPMDSRVTGAVQAAALGAFRAVGARDYGRVDVMVDAGGAPWVLEVNTLPGMTETSLLPKAAAAAGMTFEVLVGRMLDLAMRRAPATAGGSR